MSDEQVLVSVGIDQQISFAYRAMAREAKYRPAALSDGFGNITVPEEKLNLNKEVSDYTKSWWKQEDDCKFWIGCCNFETRAATIYAVEAAQQMCGGVSGNKTASKLLRMAVKQLSSVISNQQ
jgi:hypothetical protein